MAPIWIEAALALDIAANGGSKVAAKYTLCERAYAGLIRTRARDLFADDHAQTSKDIPPKFWWAKGHEALDQNWTTGDFSTWIDREVEVRAFGVRFALDDVLEILPFEQRALVARRCSVEGNADWYSARLASEVIAGKEFGEILTARKRLIEMAKLGFVTGRAVQMFSGKEYNGHGNYEREWDIPIWFWTDFCAPDRSSQNWELNKFRGRAYSVGHSRCIELNGVHFLKSTINAMLMSGSVESEAKDLKPNLARAELEKWWESMAASRDQLSHEQLLTLIRAKYPENHIARERIRELTGDRKPGKKPIGG